jgi:hypothetical protein
MYTIVLVVTEKQGERENSIFVRTVPLVVSARRTGIFFSFVEQERKRNNSSKLYPRVVSEIIFFLFIIVVVLGVG